MGSTSPLLLRVNKRYDTIALTTLIALPLLGINIGTSSSLTGGLLDRFSLLLSAALFMAYYLLLPHKLGFFNHSMRKHMTVADPGFTRGGGANILFGQIENEEILAGGRVPRAP